MTTTETCERCKFWNLTGRGDRLADLSGDCRIHSTALRVVDGRNWAAWPKTIGRDWCGDYKANPEVV